MEKEKNKDTIISVGLSSILLFIFFIVLFLSFRYLVHQQIPTKVFGWQQIAMSIVVAFITAVCFALATGIMRKNPALGAASGFAMLILGLYALFSMYSGPNTTKFAIVGSLGVLIYLGIAFWKAAKS
jgi:magnesium-transporting ATPase (P-type)